MEEPQRGVGRVIEAFLLALREHVRDQAVADVVGEGSQDVAGFGLAAGRERQPLEADHRVAAPVGEPVIAGDDRADFVAGGVGARRFLGPSGRRDDELIGGQHELGRRLPCARRRVSLRDQPLPALALGGERFVGRRARSIISNGSVDATSVARSPRHEARDGNSRGSTERRAPDSRGCSSTG